MMGGHGIHGDGFKKKVLGTVLVLIFFAFLVAAVRIIGTDYNQLGNFIKVFTLIRTQCIEEINTSTLVDGTIRGMVNALGDPYSVYLDAETFKQLMDEQIHGSFGGLGLVVGVKDGLLTVMQVYEDTPAYVNGVQASDRIIKINDRDVRGIDLETAGELMRGPVGTQIELYVLREGRHEPVQFEITREEIIIPTVESKMLSDSRIGYIMISNFTEKTPNEMLQTLAGLLDQGMRGIILDLRDNPGGELVATTQVADNFVPKGPIVYIDYRSGGKDVKNADDSYLQLPLAVLINEYSASAAEILAGAIRDTETGVLVGTTTFGKGIVQTLFPLDNGAGLKLTTARYLTPNKNDIHNKGIQPDIVVINRDDLPGDEQLDRAVQLMKEMINS
ncbi:S41 family peptidase [Desulfoscipio gibsoniae]|uniref:C-terminal processing peptidase n=1 Tax=Desulfoscipio gibsoniae DSM 7213 TaxID=767817 RepID=R4KJ84_9FIRM|nr:S41 family peptidase [Desulfoscipio gibsoniae]AGL00560.1 C-terminal processing peptidase [Desulfoscipio gibsoniae DSM 7213]